MIETNTIQESSFQNDFDALWASRDDIFIPQPTRIEFLTSIGGAGSLVI